MNAPLRGLYAITSEALVRGGAAVLLPAAEAALRGGARLLQYRDKWSAPAQRRVLAEALRAACRRHGARFIVNDDVELAAAVDAHGVHLGGSDAPPAWARERLGAQALIGVSCSGSIERALQAQQAGADYVAFGRFFASRTKPEAPPAPPELLDAARAQLSLAICAIGGITPATAGALIARGADLIAAVDGVFGAPDIAAAARAYAALF